ncbi:uncharacterized protein LOC109862582 [Pseudomyrmex gracilis]|uniref:uncharacterized protein LOC109862582 n=1 Tax=Pseudomyrmex gracilis TaxID=219809 RepID=UPI000995937D|nr:uncharacterized protein LOC109862582 [Pseudomyrmex gracilis]
MTRRGISAADWTQTMLTKRVLSLTASHKDSCLVVDELLEKLKEASFPVYSYADDVAIVVKGNFLATLKDIMKEAHMLTQNWCQSKGLRANPSKTKAMIFTRKYTLEAIEPLRSRKKTTLTEALEVALCIFPLNQQVVSAARLTAYKLKCQGEWRQFGIGHTKLGFLHKSPFTLKQDRIPRIYQVNKAFSINLSTKAEWSNKNLQIQPNIDAWFSNGPGANDRFGASIYSPGNNHRELFFLGKLATVFQAEVLAILECARLLLSKETMSKKIHIYTDSKAAIGAFARTTTESSVVWDCMQALNRLRDHNKITLVWVLGHQDIRGNEIADGLAKLGTLEEPAGQKVGVFFAVEKNCIRDQLKQEHQDSWRKLKSCRQARLLMSHPSSSRAKELLSMDRNRLKLSIGLLTGHWAFRAHLYNVEFADKTNCRLCGEEKEDNKHILCRCQSLVLKKFRSLGCMFVEPEDLKNITIGHLRSLAENAGLKQIGRYKTRHIRDFTSPPAHTLLILLLLRRE